MGAIGSLGVETLLLRNGIYICGLNDEIVVKGFFGVWAPLKSLGFGVL